MMPSLDEFFIEFSFGTSGVRSSKAEADAELDRIRDNLKEKGGEIEYSAKGVIYGFETVVKRLGGLFGIYLSFEGFKNLVTGAADTAIRLENLSRITGDSPDSLNRMAYALKGAGGSYEAYLAFAREVTKEQQIWLHIGHGPGAQWPPILSLIESWFPGYQFEGKKPSELMLMLREGFVAQSQLYGGVSGAATQLESKGLGGLVDLLQQPDFYERIKRVAPLLDKGVEDAARLKGPMTELQSAWDSFRINMAAVFAPKTDLAIEGMTKLLGVVNSVLNSMLRTTEEQARHDEAFKHRFEFKRSPPAKKFREPRTPEERRQQQDWDYLHRFTPGYQRGEPPPGAPWAEETEPVEKPRDPRTPDTPKQTSDEPGNVPGTAPATPGGFNAPESAPEAPAPTPTPTPTPEKPPAPTPETAKPETAKPETAPPVSSGRTYDIPDIPFGATGGQEVVRRMKEAGIKLPPDVEATIASGNKPTKEQLDRIPDADLDKVGSVLGKPIYHKAAPKPETKPAAKPSAEPKQDDTGGYFGGGKYKFPDLPKDGAQSMRDLEGMQVLPAALRTETRGVPTPRPRPKDAVVDEMGPGPDLPVDPAAALRARHATNRRLFFGTSAPGMTVSRETGDPMSPVVRRGFGRHDTAYKNRMLEQYGLPEGDTGGGTRAFGQPASPWQGRTGPMTDEQTLGVERGETLYQHSLHRGLQNIDYVPSPGERATSGPVTIEHHDDTETHISSLTVNTRATDAHDIAKDIHRALAENKRPSLREEREALHARPETPESPELRRLRGEPTPAPARSPVTSGDRGSTDRLMQRMNEYNAETPPPANNAARRNLGLPEIERGQDALTGSPFSAAGVRGLEGTPSGAAAPGAPPARQPPQVTAAGQGANLSGGYLRSGARGAQVRNLQSELGVTPTGRFDHRTQIAVRQFQRRTGLNPDGIVGPKTLAGLRDRKEPRPDVRSTEQ